MRCARFVGALGAILASSVFLAPVANATAVGNQRVLAVLVTFGPEPFTRADLTTTVGDAAAFFRRSSFGRLSLQPTVTPWLAGDGPPPECGASAERMFAPLRTVAARGGYTTTDYDRVLYVVAGVSCGFYGIERGTDVLLVRQPDMRLIVHELGHTFGLPHAAAAAVCSTWCVTQEQGDLFSPMGVGFTDFSAYEKEQLGWIPRQERVTRPGSYTVEPGRVRSLAHQAVVIDTTDGEYWLEQRPDTTTPALIVRVVHPDLPSSWPIPPSTMLLAPIRAGHPTIAPGQTFRVPGAFAVTVARAATPMRLKLSLAAGLN